LEQRNKELEERNRSLEFQNKTLEIKLDNERIRVTELESFKQLAMVLANKTPGSDKPSPLPTNSVKNNFVEFF